jgi:hypothetical protein
VDSWDKLREGFVAAGLAAQVAGGKREELADGETSWFHSMSMHPEEHVAVTSGWKAHGMVNISYDRGHKEVLSGRRGSGLRCRGGCTLGDGPLLETRRCVRKSDVVGWSQ